MKTKNIGGVLISLFLIVALGFIGLWLYRRFGRRTMSTSLTKDGSLANTKVLNKKLELKLGSKGAEVKALQELLNAIVLEAQADQVITPATFPLLTVDGIYGPLTESRIALIFAKKTITLNQATSLTPLLYTSNVEQLDNNIPFQVEIAPADSTSVIFN